MPPARVVRHDGDDPYLVVAADKGTATFSDIANGVAQDYGFWLGDAFASGGSVGYDHKAMGITARGAWESVKRHFRELGVDTQSQDFTVVGIGDMSGDVFGNGMLLSEHIRLVAAFDHRHVFLDPDPDPTASFTERQRLFDLPRSSWADYDTSLISAGGGVFPRSAKSIPVSPQVRAALGIAGGGHVDDAPGADARDPAGPGRPALERRHRHLREGVGREPTPRSATRPTTRSGSTAAMLRAKVVGEGGNLGFTQRGRIEAALPGVRLNTDAIDNSAGVDTSDHEVNIKILLDSVVRSGDLTAQAAQRAARRDDRRRRGPRAARQLRAERAAGQRPGAVPLDAHRAPAVHPGAGAARRARPELEFLPTDTAMDERHAAGKGLTSPELSVLVAYAKMTRGPRRCASPPCRTSRTSPGAAATTSRPRCVERYGDRLASHPLRREIVTTVVVNDMVNRGGITLRVPGDRGDRGHPGRGRPRLHRRPRGVRPARLLAPGRGARQRRSRPGRSPRCTWSAGGCSTGPPAGCCSRAGRCIDVAPRSSIFEPVSRLAAQIPDMLIGVERERLYRRAAEFEALGAPADLAVETAAMLDVFSLLDICRSRASTGEGPNAVSEVYFALSERFEVDKMLTRITQLPRDDRWSALARMALRYDLYGALAGLTRSVLQTSQDVDDSDERIAMWAEANAEGLARTRATLDDITGSRELRPGHLVGGAAGDPHPGAVRQRDLRSNTPSRS